VNRKANAMRIISQNTPASTHKEKISRYHSDRAEAIRHELPPDFAMMALIRHANVHEQQRLATVVPFRPSGAHRGADRRAA
jgi:hypothetical protein